MSTIISEKERRKALAFVQCESCSYDLESGEGLRNCHYGECPYLPEVLDLQCPTCRYNFGADDGNSECGDPPRCEFARTVIPARLELFKEWQALQGL